MRAVAAEVVAGIVDGAPETFDTLKEIADWILNDTTGAADMANDIKALEDKMVGVDSFNHFGDHEQDTVFVRNEKLKTDFEIQRDLRKYSETTHESLQNGY